MIHLNVWLRNEQPTEKPVKAGELMVAEPDPAKGGALRGEFRYDREYLEGPGAITLDPLHLPLRSGIFPADRPLSGVHGAFEDSLPDDWGRALLVRRAALGRKQQRVPNLLRAIGSDGFGALAYGEDEYPPLSPKPTVSVEALIDAALHYEAHPEALNDDELQALFLAASSPGGARPKVTLSMDGEHWLAKLPSHRDEVDMVGIEHACLKTAETAGLVVPDYRLLEMGQRRALLVRRFDISESGGRHHMLSMQTLTGLDGYYHCGYDALASVVRQVSARPEHDLPALYRQAVFNALTGNTDDHLKNFAMINREGEWRLTPAFDLTPDIPSRREHVLHFGSSGSSVPDRAALISLGSAFGLSSSRVARTVDTVAQAASRWPAHARDAGVGEQDIQRVWRDIEMRIQRCANSDRRPKSTGKGPEMG